MRELSLGTPLIRLVRLCQDLQQKDSWRADMTIAEAINQSGTSIEELEKLLGPPKEK